MNIAPRSVRPIDPVDEGGGRAPEELDSEERGAKRQRRDDDPEANRLFGDADDDDYWDALFDGVARDEDSQASASADQDSANRGGWIGGGRGFVGHELQSGDRVDDAADGPEMSVPFGVPRPHGDRPRRRRLLVKPVEPRRLERERHEVSGHLMFANWCEFCNKARALDAQHRRISDDERRGDFPTVAFDFCFMGQAEAPVKMPVLVMKDDHDGGTRAHGFFTKALSDDRGVEVVKQVVEDRKDTGYKKIVMKSSKQCSVQVLLVLVQVVLEWCKKG